MYPDQDKRDKRKRMIELQLSALNKDKFAIDTSIRMLEKEYAVLIELNTIEILQGKENKIIYDADYEKNEIKH